MTGFEITSFSARGASSSLIRAIWGLATIIIWWKGMPLPFCSGCMSHVLRGLDLMILAMAMSSSEKRSSSRAEASLEVMTVLSLGSKYYCANNFLSDFMRIGRL
jgi:hypothetical protein